MDGIPDEFFVSSKDEQRAYELALMIVGGDHDPDYIKSLSVEEILKIFQEKLRSVYYEGYDDASNDEVY